MSRVLMPAAFTILVFFCAGGTAGAQTPPPPRFSVSAGGGVADPMHSDLQFTAAAWHVGVGGNVSRLVLLEGTYFEWRHSESRVWVDIPVERIGAGAGRIGRIAEQTDYVTRTMGMNVLLRVPAGHVVLWGGGGPAMMIFTRDFRQTSSGCLGAASCGEFGHTHNAGSFAAQGVGGLDVSVGGRVALFGQYTIAVPMADPGSSHQAASGGVRLGF